MIINIKKTEWVLHLNSCEPFRKNRTWQLSRNAVPRNGAHVAMQPTNPAWKTRKTGYCRVSCHLFSFPPTQQQLV